MGKSDLTPQTQPKRKVRPISNPLYSHDEDFFCHIFKHHHLRSGEQFLAYTHPYSVSFEHEARFYTECQTFYKFTLELMNSEKLKKSTKDATAPCQVVSRPKSYRKPAKYDIQPLPSIDESSESSTPAEKEWKNAGHSAPVLMTAGYEINDCKDGQSSATASILDSYFRVNDGPSSSSIRMSSAPPLSPMSELLLDLKYPPLSISQTDSHPNEPLDSIYGKELDAPIANINGNMATDHNGIDVISIHSISESPASLVHNQTQLTSRFPNLIYDSQSDRYIKKPAFEIGDSRPSMDLCTDDLHATTDGEKGEKGEVVGRIGVRPEPAMMKYMNSGGETGIRPLALKPQVQANGLYRVVKIGLGNGSDDDISKGHLRMASEPERVGSPGTDQQIGRLRSDAEPIKRISRHPHANMSRKLNDSPTVKRRNSRRRKAGPIYLPASTESSNTSPRRPFTPVSTRSPSPRIRPVRSPPPMDRPYRHISLQSIDAMPPVDTPPLQERGSVESNPSILVDLTSFEPPSTQTITSTVDITPPTPQSTTITLPIAPESPVKVPAYSLDLPEIFSSPSPIAQPPKLPSATPATPSRKFNSNSNITPPPTSNHRAHTANLSMSSIYTPESSPHNSAEIPPTLSRIPNIPSPPNTPTKGVVRSNTIDTTRTDSTIPSTPAKSQATYSHYRNNTCSTLASSISSLHTDPNPDVSPSFGASPLLEGTSSLDSAMPPISPPIAPPNPNPNPNPSPRINNLSQESIALTEHLVREGIYGGIVYDIGVPRVPDPPPLAAPFPHLTAKLTTSELLRKRKHAARILKASLRKREREEKRAQKAEAKKDQKHLKKLKKLKAKSRKAKLAVQSKKGTLNYLSIRVFFVGIGKGVQMKWAGARAKLGGVKWQKLLGARPEKEVVGDGYDFVCRGEDEDWEDVKVKGDVMATGGIFEREISTLGVERKTKDGE